MYLSCMYRVSFFMLKYSVTSLFMVIFQNFSVSLQRKEILFLKNTEIRYNTDHYYSEKQKEQGGY